jgi:WD40 repeat protein
VHIAHSARIPLQPASSLIARLIAVERIASPKFVPPLIEQHAHGQLTSQGRHHHGQLIETPVGGGIWCLELHRSTNLLFAGCWGPSHQIDLIKCWDASTGAPMGSLYGHFSDVKCLKECGPLLYSGSYDGSVRCWIVSTMEPHGAPFISTKPVLALIATPERLYASYESGSVKCWDVASRSVLWASSHPGPVTAISLCGSSHIVSAFTCHCYNGTGFSLRKLNIETGVHARGIADEDWTPRKSISFLHPVSEDKVLMGFAAPLGTVASGAVASEHEVGRVYSVATPPNREFSRSPRQKAQGFMSEIEGNKDPKNSIQATAWGMECHATHGTNLVVGADNGTIIVSGLSGSTRRRVFDACAAGGFRSNSAKVSAVCLAGTKIFVALQTAAGDRDTEGHSGRLLCFDLVPEFIINTVQ